MDKPVDPTWTKIDEMNTAAREVMAFYRTHFTTAEQKQYIAALERVQKLAGQLLQGEYNG